MKLRSVPFDIGPIHFIGIAEIMLRIGYGVRGFDAAPNPAVFRVTCCAGLAFC